LYASVSRATTRPLRADARRNREHLLAAAAEAFAAEGAQASLDAIARRAGVGSGTLYRHFPTREALVRAVYWARVQDACARGDALRTAPDPVAALAEWLRTLLALSTRDGVSATLLAERSQWPANFAEDCRRALSAVGVPLFDRARGGLHPGVTLDDVHALVHGIADAASAGAEPAARGERLLTLVLDGLRARRGGEGMMEP
jgi:AcrR family transcriptional regulator